MLTDDFASKTDDEIVQSELSRKLDLWRHQLAKFDDESAEFVLSTSLLNYICKNSSQMQHSQDLLNLCSEHHRQANAPLSANESFVPFFVKLYHQQIVQITQLCPFVPDEDPVKEEIIQQAP